MFRFLVLPLMCLVFISGSFASAKPQTWSRTERTLYEKRHFVELIQRLQWARRQKLAREMLRHRADLRGCAKFREGTAGADSLVRCMRFVDTENEWGLRSAGRADLVSDLNTACAAMAKAPSAAQVLMGARLRNRGRGLWLKCTDALWEQVYLTAYANFEAHPVATLAMVRAAEARLPREVVWSSKIRKILH